MLKVGDKVKVREDITTGTVYDGVGFASSMNKYKGITGVITNIDPIGYFNLDIDEGIWCWSEAMVEPIGDARTTEKDVSREVLFKKLVDNMFDTYVKKNNDYGNSLSKTYELFGDISFVTRINDKMNRINSFMKKGQEGMLVEDEKIEDTIMDMANYCILWMIERNMINKQN